MSRSLLLELAPLAGLAIVAMLALLLLARFSGAQLSLRRLARVGRDQRGAVQSLSFVLTVPLYVMILLFIVQLSQLAIAKVVVEYSAFAAARSASVWLAASLGPGGEGSNQLTGLQYEGEETDAAGVRYSVYRASPNSPKVQRVRFAAVLANLAISPSRRTTDQVPADAQAALGSLERAYLATAPNQSANPRVPTRLSNKLAYAWNHTSVELTIRHRESEPPLAVHDVPIDRDEFRAGEMGWNDQLSAKVTHDFALLPGPGRFLARPLSGSSSMSGGTARSDQVASRIQRRNGTYVYTLTATATLHLEGEKPLLEFVQQDHGPTRTNAPNVGSMTSAGMLNRNATLTLNPRSRLDGSDQWSELPLPRNLIESDELCCLDPSVVRPTTIAAPIDERQPTPARRQVQP